MAILSSKLLMASICIAEIVLIIGPCLIFSPRSLHITDDSLVVNCVAYRKRIAKSDISEVKEYNLKPDALGVRTFGIGGVFGYIGHFYSCKIGRYTAFVGDSGKAFYVKLKSGKTYLLSCNNSRSFAAELAKSL